MSPNRVPDLRLERYRLDELSASERAAFERELDLDRTLRERLSAIERSDAEFHEAGLPERLAQAVTTRLRAGRQASALRVLRPALATLAAAVVVTLAWPRAFAPHTTDPAPPAAEPDSRLKGPGPGLALFRKTAGGSEPLGEGALVQGGDLVRVAYRAAGRAHGLLLSIDGRGTVTLHLPREGTHAAPLRQGTVLLDHPYQLDDAPHWERFYFVTAAAPFEIAPVLEAARRAAASPHAVPGRALDLPPGLDQAVFAVEKGASR